MSEHARHDDATTGDGGRAAVAWRPSALGIAQIVVRNLVPVAGILFFGWPVFNVLALYLVDTLLTIVAISAAVGRSFAVVADTGTGARVKMEMSVTVAGIFIAGFMAMPLGVPLIFMTNGDMAMMRTTFTDHGFRIGALVQAALVLWTYIGTRRAMAAGATPASLGLKRQFALVFLRWIAVLMVVYFGVGQLLGHYAPFLFVLVYVAASIAEEIAPDRFLRAMPGGEMAADPGPASGARRVRR